MNRLGILSIFLLLFARVADDLSRKTGLVRADLQLSNLVQSTRTPGATRAMVFVSDLGRWQTMAAGGLVLGLILLLWRRRAEVLTLALTMSLGEALVWLVKNVVQRSRPEPANAVAFESSYSFPSGHAFAAFVFYGLVASLLLPSARRWLRPILIAGSAVLIGAIGFSRIYLGVHWPSDVLASYAAGAAWLSAASIGLFVWRDRHAPLPTKISSSLLAWAAILLCGAWLGVTFALYRIVPLPQPHTVPSTVLRIPAEEIPARLFEKLPTHSEDLTGKPMEPINVVIVGPEGSVGTVFRKAGWSEADPISASSMSREIRALLTDRPYPTQPGTPSFWNGWPNMLAFEHSTPANTIRERHHIHLWNTSLIDANGAGIWVGTVHFDRGLRRSAATPVPVHSIDPLVDRQRAYVRESLAGTGDVKSAEFFVVAPPSTGKNFAGDRFETDGKAVLLLLR
ncbi:MAG: LssY C-terminal domain-containing protein [Acidobacteriota bacterium]|nr:LssY C-terminal domain-containing protein [Acidobacteriota bacterium]